MSHSSSILGEEGELLGEISWDPLKKFDGYTNKDATRNKILTDVFRQGDKYARTGRLEVAFVTRSSSSQILALQWQLKFHQVSWENFLFDAGDIMTVDEDGFVYFVDRLGDAYRWKGENVSSSEVETIISTLNNHNHAAVYAVSVPGKSFWIMKFPLQLSENGWFWSSNWELGLQTSKEIPRFQFISYCDLRISDQSRT